MRFEELLNLPNVFYEGIERFEMIDKPRRVFNSPYQQIFWTGKRSDGKVVDFLSTKDFMHYGPKIWAKGA